ncbi:MAG: hypothetical protein K6G84_02980, partial [Lachnospiraceae bacterium]|nr:hypothetical protein [Lachnospiraceae bacterium]
MIKVSATVTTVSTMLFLNHIQYLYKRGIEKDDMGYACAVGVVLMVLGLIINFVQLGLNGTLKKEED